MPICAPVGGRAGAEMNGQNTGAWSLVIRQAGAGARGGRPAAAAAGCTAARRRTGRAGAPWPPGRAVGIGGQVVAEVGEQGRHVAARRAAVPAGRGGHQASPVRVRLMPSGMVEAANATSWARSRRSGANPARRIEASRRRPNSVIRSVLGTVTVHTA